MNKFNFSYSCTNIIFVNFSEMITDTGLNFSTYTNITKKLSKNVSLIFVTQNFLISTCLR